MGAAALTIQASPLAALLPAGVALAEGDPRGAWPAPLPSEAASLARAVPRRRAEFAAGRVLARRALMSLGLPPAAIPAAADRAPVWPDGLVGSISHCTDRCVAILARRSDGFAALGIDVEPDEPLDADLLPLVATEAERAALEGLAPREAGRRARALFAAKECAYKAQFPLSGTLLEFHDLAVAFGPDGRFTARFRRNAAPFGAGDALSGRIAVDGGHIVAAMAIPTNEAPR